MYVDIKNALDLENLITSKFAQTLIQNCANGDYLIFTKLLTPVGNFSSI